MTYLMTMFTLITLGFFQLNGQNTAVLHTATNDNTFDYFTVIDNPRLNNNPEVIFFVAQNCDPCYHEIIAPLGIHYNGEKWTLFRQDFQPILEQQQFNILIEKRKTEQVLVHRINNRNTINNVSFLEHPLLDNQPNAIFFITAKREEKDPFNKSLVSIYYSSLSAKWCLVNEDYSPLPIDLMFNILINPKDAFSLSVSPENAIGNHTYAVNQIQHAGKLIDKIILVQAKNPELLKSPIGINSAYHNLAICTNACDQLTQSTDFNFCVETLD